MEYFGGSGDRSVAAVRFSFFAKALKCVTFGRSEPDCQAYKVSGDTLRALATSCTEWPDSRIAQLRTEGVIGTGVPRAISGHPFLVRQHVNT